MKTKYKFSPIKLIKNITILIVIVFIISLVVDIVRFPECYITSWKYQLQNDIADDNQQAIEYYNENYVANGRLLFNEN